MRKNYEQMECPYCECLHPHWDVVGVEDHPDYPRGVWLCQEHYEEEYPHDNCIVCGYRAAVCNMTPMGYWDDEELFFCTPCAESYPTPKEATQ